MTEEWPLVKISEPHESNDVLWHSDKKKAVELFLAEDQPRCNGNQRFRKLLEEHIEEYQKRNALAKPVLAVDLLQHWRKQSPPGRFLVMEKGSTLWKDVGNARARSQTSKALKKMAARSSCNTCCSELSMDGTSETYPSSTEASSEHEVQGSMEEMDSTQPTPSKKVALPRVQRLPKNTRRISEQLQAARCKSLYGRWDERGRLAEILNGKIHVRDDADQNDGKIDFVLIKGSMGVGKSALARTLKCPLITNENDSEMIPSFFLEGKFEHLRGANPHQVFIDIFTDFTRQLLSRGDAKQIQQYRNAILDSLQDDVKTMIAMIPSLGSILYEHERGSAEPNVDEPWSKGKDTGVLVRQKVTSLLVGLLEAVASVDPHRPLVVFFDNVHWASELSLDILTSFVSDVGAGVSVVFIASLRDDICNINPQCKKLLVMERLNVNHTVAVHDINLQNLKIQDVQDILEDSLQCRHSQIQSLSTLVFSLTEGNPMFITELLRSFQDDGLIRVDPSSGEWVCNVKEIEQNFEDIDNVADLYRKKVLSLPVGVQKTLMRASCLGSSQIDEKTMKILIAPDENLQNQLSSAVHAGLLRQQEQSYHFVSDGVQDAIYNLVPQESLAEHHLAIGQKLWGSLEDRKDPEFLFCLLNQLMMGDSLLEKEDDLRSVAALCLHAGERAAKAQGFQTAWVYLSHGMSLPRRRVWGREDYELTLRLFNASIEVCYCNANYDKLDLLINEILNNARTLEDSLLARSTQIYALGSRNRLLEAVDSGLQTLKELGETIPAYPSLRQQRLAFWRTKRMLRGLSDEDILRIAPMKDRGDQRNLAKMQICNHLFLYAFYSRPPLAALVAARMVQITLKFGLSAMSSVAFAFYSMFLCGEDSVEDGLRYGELSLRLFEKFKAEAWLCRTWSLFYGAVAPWKVKIDTTIEPLQHAYSVGLRTGDIEYAMLNASLICWNSSDILTLPVLENQVRIATAAMELSGHTLALAMLKPLETFIKGMTCDPGSADPRKWFLDAVSRDCAVALERSNEGVLLWTRAVTMVTAYFFLDYDTAESYSHGLHKIYESHAYCGIGEAFVLFYECMVLLAQARRKGWCRLQNLPYVRKRMRRLKKWTDKSPVNLLDKLYLLQAELAVVEGNYMAACADYRSAVLHAQNRGSLSDEALANERLALLLLERGKIEEARPLLKEAYRLYEQWGGTAKMRHFKHVHKSVFKDDAHVVLTKEGQKTA